MGIVGSPGSRLVLVQFTARGTLVPCIRGPRAPLELAYGPENPDSCATSLTLLPSTLLRVLDFDEKVEIQRSGAPYFVVCWGTAGVNMGGCRR